MPSQKYEPLRGSAPGPAPGPEAAEFERPCADYETTSLRCRKQVRAIRALVVLNIFLATLLCIVVFMWWPQITSKSNRPYSPAWEAVRYVNKRFKREELFHMEDETSAELDAAWKNLTGPSAGHVRLPLDEAKRNVPTLELYYDPGYYLYGVSVFHQMHCLDVLRKSYYGKHYFPEKTEAEVRMHKNHCLDYLRQSIMCSGDVTIDHWFNYTFTNPSFDPADGSASGEALGLDWTQHYSAEYMALSPLERTTRAGLLWDTEHQCRDYDALWRWVEGRQLVNEAYVEEFNRTEDVF